MNEKKQHIKWSQKEDEILLSFYPNKNTLINMLPNRQWSNIRQRAYKIHNIVTKKPWSIDEENVLRKYYYNGSKDFLLSLLPNRTWDAIKLHSASINVPRSTKIYQQSNADHLSNKTPQSLYWLGFLLADGHFSKNNRICLTLSTKDKLHLERFATFIQCENVKYTDTTVSIQFQNQAVISSLKKYYNIHHNKTENPPVLVDMNESECMSLIAGFIDGDGYIGNRKKGGFRGAIKCHSSWLPWFVDLRQRISNIVDMGSSPKINSRGYAEWHLSQLQLRQIKQHIELHNLPILERKWNKVTQHVEHRKLTDDLVRYIRQSTKNSNQLAAELNVAYMTIKNARLGITWSHVNY